MPLFCLSQKRAFSFQHYGPEEGLSNTNVFSVKQDHNHVLYLATENGVYTYDGYNFAKIKPKASLKSNFIRNIEFNEQGKLMIINRREGVYTYDGINNEASLQKDIHFREAVDELVYNDAYYYSLTDQISVSSLNRKTGEVIDDEIKKLNKNNQAFSLYKTKSGHVYVGRTDGLYEFKDGHQQPVKLPKNFSVFSIAEDTSGVLYLGSTNAVYCLKDLQIIKTIPVRTKATMSIFGFNESNVSKLLVDKYGKIWLTTQPEDNLYILENNSLFDAFDLLGIDKVLINCLYKDKNDNIWVGTFNEGVYFIQNPSLQNTSFFSGRKTLPVSCGTFIQDHIAIGTRNGFFIFDPKSGNTQTVIQSDNVFNESIYGVFQDGNTVIYSKDNSLENESRNFMVGDVYYKFIPIASRVFTLSSDHMAYLADWSGTLYKIKNYTEKKYTVLDTTVSFPDYKTRINAVYETKDRIFVGTSDGLSVFSKQNHRYANYNNPSFNFGINSITSFENKTYIAHENGVSVFEDSTFIQQAGEHRLSAVKRIKFYKNLIWLATLDGLYICNQKFEPIVIYNKSNGLLSNTINDIFFSGDSCCICSDKGITVCTISELTGHVVLPNPVFITSVDINEKTIPFSGSLDLKADETDVNINFSSPLFSKPNKQFFRYNFDGGKWTNLENTQVHITSIIGGKHNVQIICSYDGINWSQPVQITINKAVPFKETPWYAASIVAASLLIIILIALIWIRRVRVNATKRIQEERQVNLLKHQAMNSLMSPHFIFNSLTSIQNYINMNDTLRASEFLAKFSRLIRMIIEKASQSDIPLHEELTRLSYYLDLEKERFKGKFDFYIEVHEAVDTTTVQIPNMIIQPYAENSIIHGILPTHAHGNLYIRFRKQSQNELLIEIEDDGIGYNKARENVKVGHRSLGTKTIENILDLNTKLTGKKQKVSIVDKSDIGKGQGTIITISLQI
ncbi:MAG: histidine kinase [Bacteroidetes bacterium]|nr:histidine kinase [Bacteroidota bacterium]